MTRLLVAAFTAVALAGHAHAPRSDYHILLTSNRDGLVRGYSIRPDGSRLTPLLPPGSALVPAEVSADGSTIGYRDRSREHSTGFYVSRADGSGLHRALRGQVKSALLSPGGRLVAFTGGRPGVWIVGANGRGLRRLTRRALDPWAWSPDGKALALVRSVGDYAGILVVRPLHGTARALAWAEFDAIAWSPDGRWIAYSDDAGDRTSLWLVRPNGNGRHRIARDIGSFSWSLDGKSLAYTNGGDVVVAGVDGRGRRLGLSDHAVSSATWLPDGRLALTTRIPEQISIVGRDGHSLRRLTDAGSNFVVGWTRLAPVRPPARPLVPTERVVSPRRLAVRAKIGPIAADGARIAFITGPTRADCDHVAVWTPSARSVRRPVPAPCGEPHQYVDSLGPVALAGTRLAWGSEGCCGNNEYTNVVEATLPYPTSPWSYVAEAALSRGENGGTLVTGPVGHGSLLVFGIQSFCDAEASPGDEYACPPGQADQSLGTTVWRLGGGGRCPGEGRPVGGCSAVAKVEGAATVLAVDSSRIVVGTATGVEVLTASGHVIRTFPVTAKAAGLSGSRLAVETDDAIDVYDVASGRRTAHFPDATDLQDLEGDILVVAPSAGVILRRLGTGRAITVAAGTGVSAQLERQGLFVAGEHWITFTPMREIRRRLGS